MPWTATVTLPSARSAVVCLLLFPLAIAAAAPSARLGLALSGGGVRRRLPRTKTFARELRVAAQVAVECGRAILAATRARDGCESGESGVNWKDAGGIDPCTATDEANEERVRETLRAAFPDHALIGEEAASAAGAIPPIDPRMPTWGSARRDFARRIYTVTRSR